MKLHRQLMGSYTTKESISLQQLLTAYIFSVRHGTLCMPALPYDSTLMSSILYELFVGNSSC